MIKLKKKEYKKFHELSTEEKINVLRAKQTAPTSRFPYWFLFSITLFFIALNLLCFAAIFSMFEYHDLALTFARIFERTAQITGIIILIMVADVVIFTYSMIKHRRYWKPFMESLKKDKEVRY